MWLFERIKLENSSIYKIMDELNEYGKDNWELINYSETKPDAFGSKFTVIAILKKHINENS